MKIKLRDTISVIQITKYKIGSIKYMDGINTSSKICFYYF